MTTPDTAAVRAWARENGHPVAERGRLPADLHAAYLAAQGGAAGAPKPPAKARKAAPAQARRAATAPARTAPKPVAAPAPAVDVQPDRFAELEEQLAALTARVAVLEKPAPAPAPSAKPSLFRRRNG